MKMDNNKSHMDPGMNQMNSKNPANDNVLLPHSIEEANILLYFLATRSNNLPEPEPPADENNLKLLAFFCSRCDESDVPSSGVS